MSVGTALAVNDIKLFKLRTHIDKNLQKIPGKVTSEDTLIFYINELLCALRYIVVKDRK